MDALQEKIRKLKCPIVVDFALRGEDIPAHFSGDYGAFARELLDALKGQVPGVRFSFDQFMMMADGPELLRDLLKKARENGFYVILEGPAVLSPWAAQRAAEALLGEESLYPCDGLILSPYIGSDGIKPFVPACKGGKDVFFAVRSANKSAAELQDMMTGSRLVHAAAADIVNRYAEGMYGKCGYSTMGIVAAGTSGSSVMSLRSKYNRLFLLVDGYDYPGGNGKNCSYGFDKFGHGCAVSVGPAILAAWKNEDGTGEDYLEKALQAVQRVKNNLKTYVTIL